MEWHCWVYGVRVVVVQLEVQRAPMGVGSLAVGSTGGGGEEAASLEGSSMAWVSVARSAGERSARSLIVMAGGGWCR